MKQVKKLAQLLVALLLAIILNFGSNPRPAYALDAQSTGSTAWNLAGTWTTGEVPGTNQDDTVTILGGHTVTLNVNAPAVHNITALTVNDTGTLNDSTAQNTLTVAGPVTIGGAINFSTLHSILSATGNLTINNTGTLTQGTGAVTVQDFTIDNGGAFTQGGALNVNGNTDVTMPTWTIQNGIFSPTGTVDVTGNLTINSTLTQGANNVTVSGNLAIGGAGIFTANAAATTIEIGGNWANSNTFTANGSTVLFADVGNHTITGTSAFNNLTFGPLGAARILTFPDAVVTNVGGTLTLLGTAGNILTLVSSAPGVTQWGINPTNYNIDYVDVSWSNNSGATINVPVTTNTDSGNNTNWNFFTPVPTLTEWGMIIFTGLLLLSSIVVMKRRGRTASSVM